jgi:hypothetical protein
MAGRYSRIVVIIILNVLTTVTRNIYYFLVVFYMESNSGTFPTCSEILAQDIFIYMFYSAVINSDF